MGRYIENMTSVTTMVEAMHGAGSPQAQRIVMLALAGIDGKIKLAEQVINGEDNAPGLTVASAKHRTVAETKVPETV